MAEDKRQRVILIFENMVVSLDATVRHPEVEESHREIGQVYLEVSRDWLSHLRSDRGREIVRVVPDAQLGELGRRSSQLTNFVSRQQWGPLLTESHALLSELPGMPDFGGGKPRPLPRPPRVI
jgi:hypothetical protein